MQAAYTRIEEWGWTLMLSVHRTKNLAVPLETGAFRFHWVVSGSCAVHTEGRKLSIEAPSLLCLGSRDQVVSGDGAEIRTVVFHPGALNDSFLTTDVYDLDAFQGTTKSDQYYLHPFIRARDEALSAIPVSLAMVDRLQYLFDRMEDEMEGRGDFWPCRTRSLLLEALMLTRQGYSAPAQAFADKVLTHLHTHYAQAITLTSLASQFATNRTTLAARFREKTGTSVGEYLRRLRVHVAEVLLRDTTIPVLEVMERVGFSDPSQFGRLFRRETKLSPSAYRSQHNWMLRSAS